MRVAIVHHWFVTRGGGERVAECIASLFPKAEIFALIKDPRGVPETLSVQKIHTSFLQRIPFAKSHHRHMMPLYPAATEALDLRGFDLVISSDSGPVKGIRIDPKATHICYCHSPMRYLYDGYESYRTQMGPITRTAFSFAAGRVRKWDTAAAQRVGYFIANSKYVADRIRRVYGRDSAVIYPPIDLHYAQTAEVPGPHYLCAGRLVGYKRTDLMIGACKQLKRSLRIVGAGPEEARLRKLVGSADIKFLGELPTADLWREYANCRALLFAADEDFGMVPLEAQACGRPVIAYGAGGSLETVRGAHDGSTAPVTGIYFAEQSIESVIQSILRFETADSEGVFQPDVTRSWAATFGTNVFLRRMREFILSIVPNAEEAMTSLPVD